MIRKSRVEKEIDDLKLLFYSIQKDVWLVQQQKNDLIEEISIMLRDKNILSNEINNLSLKKETISSELSSIELQKTKEYNSYVNQKDKILSELQSITSTLEEKKKEIDNYNKIKLIDKEWENKKALQELSLINQEYSIVSLKLDQIKLEIANFDIYRKQSIIELDEKERNIINKEDQLNSKESILKLKEDRLNQLKKELKGK